jgi:hypothetical protein
MLLLLGLALLFAPACDGEDGDDSDEQAGDTGTDTDMDMGDGDGDGEGDGDGDVTPGKTGDGDGDTGELMGCALNQTESDCYAVAGCGAVLGSKLVGDEAEGWCTLPEQEFIGCANATELCSMLAKTLCDGENVWRTNGCVPDNVSLCEAPGEITGVCG